MLLKLDNIFHLIAHYHWLIDIFFVIIYGCLEIFSHQNLQNGNVVVSHLFDDLFVHIHSSFVDIDKPIFDHPTMSFDDLSDNMLVHSFLPSCSFKPYLHPHNKNSIFHEGFIQDSHLIGLHELMRSHI